MVTYSTTIKEMPEDDRPRERLRALGAGALSTAELLAILIGGGYQDFSALNLAQHLLRQFDGLGGLEQCELEELCSAKGIGLAKASTIMAAVELGRRIARSGTVERPQITSPESAKALLLPRYGHLKKEQVGVLILDTKNRVLREEIVSVGILDGSMVHPREVFRPALLASAAAIVLFHNHPSGDPTPSTKDIEITRRLVDAGELMGIKLLDHIIIGRNEVVSLKRRKLF